MVAANEFLQLVECLQRRDVADVLRIKVEPEDGLLPLIQVVLAAPIRIATTHLSNDVFDLRIDLQSLDANQPVRVERLNAIGGFPPAPTFNRYSCGRDNTRRK